jgi:hypothetical protein
VRDEASRILNAMLQRFEQSDLTPKLIAHVHQDCRKDENDETAKFCKAYTLLELSVRFKNRAHISATPIQGELMERQLI